MKIGDITLTHNLILAPMAGVSDLGFRSVCVMCGADFGECEMVSARALVYNSDKTIKLLETTRYEKIRVAQIFGNEPEIMARAINHPAMKKFDIIDINMGCPAPKIVNNGQGSALLKDMDLAYKIISTCVKSTTKPIMVKFRIGYNMGENVAVEFAKMFESAGASAITVHGRYTAQGYSGRADLDTIKRVKQAVTIPVIGNGDVVDSNTYKAMLDTGVDAVMIGRGACGNPKIFSTLLGIKSHKMSYYVQKHYDIVKNSLGDAYLNSDMIKHFLWYAKNCKNRAEVRRKIVSATDSDSRLKIILDNLEERDEKDN